MVKDLLLVIRDHYKNDLVFDIAQLMFNGPLIPDEECKNLKGPMMRAGANQIKEMNARRLDAKDYRELLEVVLYESTKPETEYELPLLAWYLSHLVRWFFSVFQ